MNKRHINLYCILRLLFSCTINGTQLQSLPSLLQRLSENDQNTISLAAAIKRIARTFPALSRWSGVRQKVLTVEVSFEFC